MRHTTATTWTTILASLLLFSSVARAQETGATDLRVAAAVDSELFLDQDVPAHRIDVSVEDRVVTLEGTVDDLLARERAARLTKALEGVRAVVNRIEVEAPDAAGDAELRKDVEKALLDDPATEEYEIDVSVQDGVVTLAGEAGSWAEKRLATQVAKDVSGVREVQSEVEVELHERRPDPELEAEIERRLASDVYVQGADIEVAVEDATARLTGSVPTVAQKDRAVMDALVHGIRAVDTDGLLVRAPATRQPKRPPERIVRSDSWVRESVLLALEYDPRVVEDAVRVTVDEGTVTLRGVVDNRAARLAAEQDARNTVGVWLVRNHVRVRPETIPDDDVLERVVEGRLRRDPFIERYEIAVAAWSGTVHLTGQVDSRFERERAELLASRVAGVVDVRNGIVVRPRPVRDDQDLARRIRDRMDWNPYVEVDEVTVTVEDGTAILTGTVDTYLERSQAASCAEAAGAPAVRNRVKVRKARRG